MRGIRRALLAVLAAAGWAALPVQGAAQAEVPVLLVPGWFDTERDLAALRIRLISAGWPPDRVETITFAQPTGSNRSHADELERAIAELTGRTGAERIDVVAHSMGGLATRWYLLTRGGRRVRRAVFLGSPHHGTYAAYLAWGQGGSDMEPESPFLDTLNAAPPVPPEVEAITIRTPLDTRILPGESATLPGVPDFEVCCPTHAGLLRNLDVFRLVRRFLSGRGLPVE
ncbi:MAG: hypothetical protein OEZ65_03270 [Gemmatimonadota bacterium]|nr:hypothetical protein [Gemmatimonadota bacterium]MDH5758582.1 hypothetical protein [Gemmatimonadota bacterium]